MFKAECYNIVADFLRYYTVYASTIGLTAAFNAKSAKRIRAVHRHTDIRLPISHSGPTRSPFDGSKAPPASRLRSGGRGTKRDIFYTPTGSTAVCARAR